MSMGCSAAAGDRSRAIAARLSELLGAPASGLTRLSGGASRETWAFQTGGNRAMARMILQADRLQADEAPGRRPRPLQAPILRAAAHARVPVPAVVAAGEDDRVLGPAWMVVEHVEGTADPLAILAGEGVPPADALLEDLAAALAAVHRIAPDGVAVPRVADPLDELRALNAELDQPHPVFELAFRELRCNRPLPSPRCLVHGDFRIGNVLVGPRGVAAVLDWELAHVGDPLEDLGWLCVRAWRFQRPDLPAAGLGSRESLAHAYERHSGRAVDLDALRWWELFATLRWGVFCVVQAMTHLSGAAPSLEHAVIGRRACEVEWDLLELLDPGGGGDELPTRDQAGPSERALHDRPTAPELLGAVRGALGQVVLPRLDGRAAFELRVALRALGIVQRELRHATADSALLAGAVAALGAPDQAALATAIREGGWDSRRAELVQALRALVRAKLEVANPRHLEPIETPQEGHP